MSIYTIDPEISISIETTTNCNYRCHYCNIQNKSAITLDTFKKIINNVDEDVDREQLKIVLSGCEPLSIPTDDLFGMIDCLEEQKISTSIISRMSVDSQKFNLILEKLKQFSSFRRFVACISTFDAELYQREVGHGAIDIETVKNNCIEAEKLFNGFLMSLTINKTTLPSAIDTLTTWLSIGQYKKFKQVTIKSRRKYRFSTMIDETAALTSQEMIDLYNKAIEIKNKTPFFLLNSSICQPACEFSNAKIKYPFIQNKCIGPVLHLGINTEGIMRMCAFLPDSEGLRIGDAKTEKLSDLIQKAKEFYKTKSKIKSEECLSCDKYDNKICLGGCPFEYLV